jgi:lincosamide nucleotidyltransferase A/C/D/E
MNAADVIEIYTELERLGVRIWIDGGWGVDALLGRQTRPHADLDIAVEENSVQALRTVLGGVDTYLIHKTIAARVMTAR